MNKLFVGMDVSLNDVKVHILDQEGNDASSRFSVENNPHGCDVIVSRILECCNKYNIQKVFIGLESTSVYGWHLQYYLADHSALKPYQPSITTFNANIINAFKKSLGNLPKNDWIDAFAIAEKLRFGRLPKSCSVDFRYLALQRLTRHRFHIVNSIVREKNYLLSNLFLKFSGLCQNKVFSNNFGATATEIFNEFFTLDDIAARPLDELAGFLVDKSKDRFDDPEATAKLLQEAVRKSYRINATVDDSLNFVIKSCFDNLQSLEKQKKAVEKAIINEVKGFNNEFLCLTSVKGIGPTIAAGLISEIGGISRFDNDNALAKFSGLYWSEYQSADFKAEDTYLKRTGNEYLRYYFIQAADQLRKYLPEFSQYYARKFKESKTHKHKRALVLTARKTVRLVFALLREEKLYKSPIMKGDDCIS
ncbi:IS110-like element ISDha12 family transposase [Thermoanaerobacter brockii subsp. lactiethylicus]|uniref:Transposase IS116/IS110/IS902 family protein n=3 Tax=Thermoanaerobacteraceae TaxID=186814 RepID=B0K7B1_THEP3|nr:transposase IS116/IS110/IS902 family protein [Thermoanaerobacter sp. X514]ABY93786.1 transposase IS116/IS110/IS902 family protein [Thermoanaerobacter pseudethanolicus ATCC 33223]ADV78750.1 transposase IS116/IS110/IS902 family protein [Thermoanaerobacter brockii subsp. finnii Ako-1]ABY93042.1 transposase IS116/IS110/IS902 family protein [Thermoanaerobacter sp. X514]ABY94123.1 transposase IS116/IS110/IS902 family protein [Thermoanaerobacter pseudethanolicus ATCC 33223]